MASETATSGRTVELDDLLDRTGREGISAGDAVLVIGQDGHSVLWTNARAARGLGHADAAGLLAAALPAESPGARRLAELGRDPQFTAGGRLEKLRFFVGFRHLLLTAICSPVRLKDGRAALLVTFAPEPSGLAADSQQPGAKLTGSALDGIHEATPDAMLRLDLVRKRADRAEPAAEPPRSPTEEAASPAEIPSAAASPEPLQATTAIEAAQPFADDLSAPAEEAVALEPTGPILPAWLALDPAARQPVRFTFATAADGTITRLSPHIAQTLGDSVFAPGARLDQAISSGDAEAGQRLSSALAEGNTFSGLGALLPVAGSHWLVPVTFSALPLGGQTGAGLAGFGTIRLDQAFESLPPADLADFPAEPAPAAADGASGSDEWPDTDAGALDTPAEDAAAAIGAATEAAGARDVEAEVAEAAPFPPPDEAAGEIVDSPMAPQAAADPHTPDGSAAPERSAAQASGTEPEAAPPLTPEARRAALTTVPAAPPPPMPNVVSIRTGQPTNPIPGFQRHGLSNSERNAFREIARALGARFEDEDGEEPASEPQAAAEREMSTPRISEEAAAEANPLPAPERRFGRRLLDGAAPERVEMPGSLIDRIPIGVLVLKEDRPLYANATLLDLTGYPDFLTFAAEDGPRAIFRKSVLPREKTGIDTVALTTRDGELVPVDAHLQLIDWDGGKATLISMRRAAEIEQGRALRTVALDLKRARGEAGELRAILDTATDGVLTLDGKGSILSLNGAAEALFGLAQNEVVGESFTRLLVNESHADALDYLDGLKAAGVKSVLNDGRDVFGREKNGGKIPLFMTLGRINDDEPRRYCAVLRDMTAWKRAEAQLTEARRAAEQASAKKSDFLAKISHEIRTPMNAIIGFAELMQEERLGRLGAAKYKEYLGDIRTSGQHVVSLVNDLLDLAKIEAGRMEMNFAATDINAVVASSVGIIQPQANAARVLVRTQLAGKLPPVVADERSIRQIVLNMLSNATRYTEAGGQVIVATALVESGEAVIRIRDTGIGMSVGEIEQALEPFRQVGSTLRRQGGTGLGLPLTKALVKADRASFAIRSTPGEGTLVEITFPATRVLAE